MTLYEGFEKIKTVCNNTTDDNEIVALFKLIGEKLYVKGLNAGNKITKYINRKYDTIFTFIIILHV